MFKDNKIVVVMPAYNAAKTLVTTYKEVMEENIVDEIILVDDSSTDNTVEIAKKMKNITVHAHESNIGYGANQKSCYKLALEHGAAIVIMIHPDYQYTPKLIPAMAGMLANNLYSCVLGSRILGGGAIKGGMPIWKYISNRFITIFENIFFNASISEYHTGYRAFNKELLRRLPLEHNSNGFVFDNEMIAQILWYGFEIGEISCPTNYHHEASSVNFKTSLRYGFGCLKVAIMYRLAKWRMISSSMFPRL